MVGCVDPQAAVRITDARRLMVYSTFTMRAFLVSLAACTQFGRGALPAQDAAGGDGSPDATDAATLIDALTYRANAVEFDTAGNDFMTKASIGATDSASGTLSVWLRFHAGDGALQDVAVATVAGYGGGVTRTTANQIRFVMMNCTGGPILDVNTQMTYTTTSGWIHVLASWDLTAQRADIYIGENPDRAVGGTISAQNICYHLVSWGIGGASSGVLDADVADLYADLGTFTDFTDATKRRKFSTLDGKPIPLGPMCTSPSGSQPTLCFVSAPSTWNKDSGSGGDFTINGDGLTTAPTSP
jgi:hypothetical protein